MLISVLDAFYNAGAEIIADRSNAPNLQSGGAVQLVPLSFSSFTAGDKSQHENIQKLRGRVFCIAHRWEDRVYTDHAAVTLHALAAIPEKLNALLVLPVVNDVLHDIDAGGRHRLEHISTGKFQPLDDCCLLHRYSLARNGNQFRKIHDDGL